MLKTHGTKMRNARLRWRASSVCPDCYLPKHLCDHRKEWTFLLRRTTC